MLNISQVFVQRTWNACLFFIPHDIFWLLSSEYSSSGWMRLLSCLHQACNALCFPATNWIGLRKLQEFDVSDNRLVELPTVFLYCFKSLNILNVSRNQLKVFPDPWACPLVSQTALSESQAVKAVETVQNLCCDAYKAVRCLRLKRFL